jgi:hypothetical protein
VQRAITAEVKSTALRLSKRKKGEEERGNAGFIVIVPRKQVGVSALADSTKY